MSVDEVFALVGRPGELADDDWWNYFREEFEVVASQEWDGNAPGHSGVVSVILVRGVFLAETDFGLEGPFADFDTAAQFTAVLERNETTVGIWVAPRFAV